MTAPTRPLLRWHGGKWLLAPWIIKHFPPHRAYVEPFGGAFSVGLRKPRVYAEVWNDLDECLVQLFAILRDRTAADELIRQLRLTPFARAEFNLAYQPCDDPIERARRTVVRSFMGFGSDATNGVYRTGFRASSNRSGTTPAHDWSNYPDALQQVVERVDGVTLESRDALEVMEAHDGPDTLHFLDPPYLHETRSRRSNRRGEGVNVYTHELSDADHERLLAFLPTLEGMVVLSGYPSAMYDDALSDWWRVEKPALADGARPRTEVLWVNPAAVDRLGSGPLFRAPSPTPLQSTTLERTP